MCIWQPLFHINTRSVVRRHTITTLIGIVVYSSICVIILLLTRHTLGSLLLYALMWRKSIHFTDTTPLHIVHINETVYYPLKISCNFFLFALPFHVCSTFVGLFTQNWFYFHQNRGSNKFDHIKQNLLWRKYAVAAYKNLILLPFSIFLV